MLRAEISKCAAVLVAFCRIDVHLRAGEIFGVLGPNGARKSTLLGAISGELAAWRRATAIGCCFCMKGRRTCRVPSKRCCRRNPCARCSAWTCWCSAILSEGTRWWWCVEWTPVGAVGGYHPSRVERLEMNPSKGFRIVQHETVPV